MAPVAMAVVSPQKAGLREIALTNKAAPRVQRFSLDRSRLCQGNQRVGDMTTLFLL